MTKVCQKVECRLAEKDLASCTRCRHGIPSSRNFYCVKLKQRTENMVHCHYFEPEPLEYKLYKRM